MSLHVTLSKQPADLVLRRMLVETHGYTCGFFSLVSLFISGIQDMTDILVTVARSVLEEASLKMGNKSVLKT